LEHDLAVLRQACTATDEQLETWKKQPPKRRPQPRVRRRSSPSFDSF
jgi:hypothetical protein